MQANGKQMCLFVLNIKKSNPKKLIKKQSVQPIIIQPTFSLKSKNVSMKPVGAQRNINLIRQQQFFNEYVYSAGGRQLPILRNDYWRKNQCGAIFITYSLQINQLGLYFCHKTLSLQSFLLYGLIIQHSICQMPCKMALIFHSMHSDCLKLMSQYICLFFSKFQRFLKKFMHLKCYVFTMIEFILYYRNFIYFCFKFYQIMHRLFYLINLQKMIQ